MADHNGSKKVHAYGCPVFSSGEPYYSETMMSKAHRVIVDWFREVAADPEYENPQFARMDFGGEEDDEPGPQTWDGESGVREIEEVEKGIEKVEKDQVTVKVEEVDEAEKNKENVKAD